MLDEKRNRGRRRVVIEIDTNDKRESFNARVVTMVQSFVHDDEQAVFLTTEDVEK